MLLWASSSWLQGKSWRWRTCPRWAELWASTPSRSSWACSSTPPSSCPPSTSWSHAKTPLCSSEACYRPLSPPWAPPPGEQHTCTAVYITPYTSSYTACACVSTPFHTNTPTVKTRIQLYIYEHCIGLPSSSFKLRPWIEWIGSRSHTHFWPFVSRRESIYLREKYEPKWWT